MEQLTRQIDERIRIYIIQKHISVYILMLIIFNFIWMWRRLANHVSCSGYVPYYVQHIHFHSFVSFRSRESVPIQWNTLRHLQYVFTMECRKKVRVFSLKCALRSPKPIIKNYSSSKIKFIHIRWIKVEEGQIKCRNNYYHSFLGCTRGNL